MSQAVTVPRVPSAARQPSRRNVLAVLPASLLIASPALAYGGRGTLTVCLNQGNCVCIHEWRVDGKVLHDSRYLDTLSFSHAYHSLHALSIDPISNNT